jgi:hypothetical protein
MLRDTCPMLVELNGPCVAECELVMGDLAEINAAWLLLLSEQRVRVLSFALKALVQYRIHTYIAIAKYSSHRNFRCGSSA